MHGRVLITGFTGFVGSHMADLLLEETDCEVYGALRWRSPKENVQHILDHPRVHLVEMDLLDSPSVDSAIRTVQPDYVLHFAAQSSPQASFKVPRITLSTNIEGSVNLFEAIAHLAPSHTRTLVISSSEVYGNPLPEEVPINEGNPIRAANPYSISKVGEDFMAQYYQKAYDLDMVITRMFSHEGSRRGLDFALSSFAYQIAQAEKKGKAGAPHTVRVGNLHSVRTYIHIRDAIRAYVLAMDKGEKGAIYNIGGNSSYTVGQALDLMITRSKLTLSDFNIVVDPKLLRPTDITLQIPDCSKFKKQTGWEPASGLPEIVDDLLDWWRARV